MTRCLDDLKMIVAHIDRVSIANEGDPILIPFEPLATIDQTLDIER